MSPMLDIRLAVMLKGFKSSQKKHIQGKIGTKIGIKRGREKREQKQWSCFH